MVAAGGLWSACWVGAVTVAVAVTVGPAAVETWLARNDGLALTAVTLVSIAAAVPGVTNTSTSRTTESPEARRRWVLMATTHMEG